MEMKKLLESIDKLQAPVEEGFFDWFRKKKDTEPVISKKEPALLSPEEEAAKKEKEKLSWQKSTLKSYDKVIELINMNQFDKLNAAASRVKSNVKLGLSKGYATFSSDDIKKQKLNGLNKVLSMKEFDAIKVKDEYFAGTGTGALIGAALAGPLGAVIGGGLGSVRRTNKQSQQDAKIAQAYHATQQKRQNNKDLVIDRLQKYRNTFIRNWQLNDKTKKSLDEVYQNDLARIVELSKK